MWSPDGKTLYFGEWNDKLLITFMAATFVSNPDVAANEEPPEFEIGEVKEYVNIGKMALSQIPRIMPDGKSILIIASKSKEGDSETVDDLAVIHATRNFFTRLEELAPTRINAQEANRT